MPAQSRTLNYASTSSQMEFPLEKLAFLSLFILLLGPKLGVGSQPSDYSYTGHMGHYLYYVISAPPEVKVGGQMSIKIEVWSTYDINLTSYRLRVYGAGINVQSGEVSQFLPQGNGIPKTMTVTTSREDIVYLEVRAEYDYEIGGQHQQGYGDITMPITTARAETLEEIVQRDQQLMAASSNYTQLEGQYLEVKGALQEAQSQLGNQTASYEALRAAYEQLQTENGALQANYDDALHQLELQRTMAMNYEYVAIAAIVATVITLLVAVVTRRRGRASGQQPSRKT